MGIYLTLLATNWYIHFVIWYNICIDIMISETVKFFKQLRLEVCHGNGDGGNTSVTAVMGTTFTVIPWRWGHVSRGYRGDGEQC